MSGLENAKKNVDTPWDATAKSESSGELPRSTIGIAAVQTAIEYEYDEIRYEAFHWESVRDQAPCERRELTHAIAVSRELHPATQRFAQGPTSDDQHRPLG